MNKRLIPILLAAGIMAAHSNFCANAQDANDSYSKIVIDITSQEDLSPYIFGHNLEHTRACINGGLSAQMLQNRKFAGKPSRNQGVAAHWSGIGANTVFLLDGAELYTKHICLERMWRRNELSSQGIENMTEGCVAGIRQNGLAVEAGRKYELRTVTKVSRPLVLRVEVCDRDGNAVYAGTELQLAPSEDWEVTKFEMTPAASDANACIRYTFTEQAEIRFGALSMMPADHFHGMRRDVVENLKAIGPSLLRWPGGNFAGEYRWKDGLLDVDMRGPLGAATEIETQPYTDGFDYHEINTDDFIALCREVGAEPFLTINLAWSTPEESVQWLEYCNGGSDTEYGRIRAERGYGEPYNVKFWSLGNEMGYGHMEGPMGPSGYADLASEHAEAMLKECPDLKIFSSGPYPNDDWAANSAARLSGMAPYVSLHMYYGPGGGFHYTSEEDIHNTYNGIVSSNDDIFRCARSMRECLDKTGIKMHISFDEWNQWYSWYRPSCVSEGIFAAKFLHGIINLSTPLDIPVCCYFQPVGEGAIIITPTDSRLSANGQIFSLMKEHKGGKLCSVSGADEYDVTATIKDGILTVTLLNDSYDQNKNLELAVKGQLQNARLLSSDDVRPYTYFTESELPVIQGKKSIKISLPPHSVASLEIVMQ